MTKADALNAVSSVLHAWRSKDYAIPAIVIIFADQVQAELEGLPDRDAVAYEACAKVCETLTLTLDKHNYPSREDRALFAVVEAGCRGAFADAIRDLPNV